MEERILNTIFIHMSRNVIGYLLEIISCIAHRNTGACLPYDGNIIAAIAESHGFFYVQTQIISHCMQALALIRIGCRNIRKGRMPSARGAVAERRHQERLLLYRTERSNLQYLLISKFIHIGQEDFTIHPQSLGKDFINLVSIMMDSEMMLSYDDCRIIITVGCSIIFFTSSGRMACWLTTLSPTKQRAPLVVM